MFRPLQAILKWHIQLVTSCFIYLLRLLPSLASHLLVVFWNISTIGPNFPDTADVDLLLISEIKNSMVWVRERTIPIERPPLVGEVIANCLRIEGATWSAWRIPTAVFSVFYTGAATFLLSSSSVVPTRLSGPRSRPTTFFLVVPRIETGPPDL
jgi:hypothetical protein